MNRTTSLPRAITIALMLSTVFLLFTFGGGERQQLSAADKEPREITWQELIPEDFKQPENPFITMSQEEIDKLMDGSAESLAKLDKMQEEFNYAPTVPSLDGLRVKLPAYITPLDFDGQMKMEEFLLVPYQGACMHTPPPPSNQIVHAQAPEAIEVDDPYSPVWAIGKLRVDTVQSALAEAGYRLEVEKVMPYTRP